MRNADDIFKEFFGGRDPFASFFDDDDDFFGRPFGGRDPFANFGKMGGGIGGMQMHSQMNMGSSNQQK